MASGRVGGVGYFKIPPDRFSPPIHFGGASVKETRAFAAIAHSINFFRAADPSDKRAPKQSLKIECEIGTQLSGFFEPRHHANRRAESAKFTARKYVDVIDVGTSPQERREFRIHHPLETRFTVRIANRGHCRQRVNAVAERTCLDDQNRIHRFTTKHTKVNSAEKKHTTEFKIVEHLKS